MKKVVFHYCFIPLLFSLFAFYFLFIGSGKQKCYQIKVNNFENYEIDFNDPMKKEDEWTIGVFFYG